MALDSSLEPTQGEPASSTDEVFYTAAPLPPRTRLDKFHIDHLIHESAAGYTYSANEGLLIIQEYFPQQIAVRDLDGVSVMLWDATADEEYQQGLSAFLLLARVLSQTDHPGRVTHYQEQNDTAYYVLQLEPRTTWADLLSTGQRLPEDTLRSVLLSAVDYLGATHAAGLFHLQIAPDNLLLSENEELALMGFNPTAVESPSRLLAHKSPFRAPELSHDHNTVGPWTDYYSLGALLYQGVMRIPPADAIRRTRETSEGRPDPLITAKEAGKGYYGDSLLQIIDQLLSLEPAARPSSSDEITGAFGSSLPNEEDDERNRPLLAIGRAFSRLTTRSSIIEPDADAEPKLGPLIAISGRDTEGLDVSETRSLLPNERLLKTTATSTNSPREGASAVILSGLETSPQHNTHTGYGSTSVRPDLPDSMEAIETSTDDAIPTLTHRVAIPSNSLVSSTNSKTPAALTEHSNENNLGRDTQNHHRPISPPTLSVYDPHDQMLNTDGPAQNVADASEMESQHRDKPPTPHRRQGLRWLAWLVAVTAIGVISYFWLQLYNPPPVTHSSTRIELMGSHDQRGGGLVSDANASVDLSDIKAANLVTVKKFDSGPTIKHETNLTNAINAYYGGRYGKAYRLFRPLAAQGNHQAQFHLGRILGHDLHQSNNTQAATPLLLEALPTIQKQANQRVAWAQGALGDYFADGLVVEKSYTQAAFWYRKGAAQGHPGSQNNLGWLYMKGLGVEPNADAALRLFHAAAQQGVYQAQRNLDILEGMAATDN
jgi:serine/threonine protein kinase